MTVESIPLHVIAKYIIQKDNRWFMVDVETILFIVEAAGER